MVKTLWAILLTVWAGLIGVYDQAQPANLEASRASVPTCDGSVCWDAVPRELLFGQCAMITITAQGDEAFEAQLAAVVSNQDGVIKSWTISIPVNETLFYSLDLVSPRGSLARHATRLNEWIYCDIPNIR
jgi:hypothetical protein